MKRVHARLLLAALLSSSEGVRPGAGVTTPPLRVGRAAPVLRALRGGGDAQIKRGGGDAQIKLSFSVVCDSTNMGEDVGVIGECEELGNWKKAVRMNADQVGRWRFLPSRPLVATVISPK
jgi:hypothetical protein